MQSGLYGLRWRTKAEVVEGRGQFSCGCKGCDKRQQLASYELPFSYKEQGEQRQALVKVTLLHRLHEQQCSACPESAAASLGPPSKKYGSAAMHHRAETAMACSLTSAPLAASG